MYQCSPPSKPIEHSLKSNFLDKSPNASYLSVSFKLFVVSAVMSRQLTLFGKVPVSQKVYGKLTNNYEQLVNAFVADERRSPSGCGQMFCLPVRMTESAWRKASLFQFWNSRFLNLCWHVHIYLMCWYSFKATYSSILASKKSAICVRMGEGGGGVTPMWKTLGSENKC